MNHINQPASDDSVFFNTHRHSDLVDVVQYRLFRYRYLHEFHSCPEDVTNTSLAQMDL